MDSAIRFDRIGKGTGEATQKVTADGPNADPRRGATLIPVM